MRTKNILFIIPVLLYASCGSSNNSASTPTNTPQNNTVTIPDSAQYLFEAKCASCHGADGTAGIANAANLKISSLDSVAIIQTITNGRGGMPSFKNAISEKDIHKLAGYVYTLRK